MVVVGGGGGCVGEKPAFVNHFFRAGRPQVAERMINSLFPPIIISTHHKKTAVNYNKGESAPRSASWEHVHAGCHL